MDDVLILQQIKINLDLKNKDAIEGYMNRRKESGEREATYEIRKDKIHKLNY